MLMIQKFVPKIPFRWKRTGSGVRRGVITQFMRKHLLTNVPLGCLHKDDIRRFFNISLDFIFVVMTY